MLNLTAQHNTGTSLRHFTRKAFSACTGLWSKDHELSRKKIMESCCTQKGGFHAEAFGNISRLLFREVVGIDITFAL